MHIPCTLLHDLSECLVNVDEIVIDANMDLQCPHRMSLMPPSPTYSALDHLQSGFVPWSTLYPVDKVPVPTRMDLEATTLLKMLKKSCWWCWRPWRWSWCLDGCWRSPRWVEEALMTHSVVIHAMMMSWVPRRRSGKPTSDVLMYLDHRGPRAWVR